MTQAKTAAAIDSALPAASNRDQSGVPATTVLDHTISAVPAPSSADDAAMPIT